MPLQPMRVHQKGHQCPCIRRRYVNFARSMQKIEKFMQSLDNEYVYTDKGDIKSYFGIGISEMS
jgi:predicted ABC-type ATPase